MNLKEFVRFTYGLFMGTSTPFLKPAKRYLFPVFRKEVTPDFGLFLGGSGICGYLHAQGETVVINTNQGFAAASFRKWVDEQAPQWPITVLLTSLDADFAGGSVAFSDAKGIFANPANSRQLGLAVGGFTERTETVSAEKLLECAGEKIYLIPVAPVASATSLVVFLERHSVLFLGPLFFNRIHPILRADADLSVKRWTEVVDGLLKRFQPRVIVPAEGDIGSETDVRNFLNYLRDLADPAVEFSYCRKTYDWPEIPSYTSLEENFDQLRQNIKTHTTLNS